tara:strand:- start:1867 stop:2283 length:417 start_codon:yes stop_codon:yes gene_type:complete
MVGPYRKLFLIFLTVLLDIGFLYVIKNESLNEFDKNYLYNLFVIHIIFIVALIYNIKLIIDVSHCFMFIAIYLGFMIENKSILIILFSLSLIQSILKEIVGECILSTEQHSLFGQNVDKYNQYCVYIILAVLLYKIML